MRGDRDNGRHAMHLSFCLSLDSMLSLTSNLINLSRDTWQSVPLRFYASKPSGFFSQIKPSSLGRPVARACSRECGLWLLAARAVTAAANNLLRYNSTVHLFSNHSDRAERRPTERPPSFVSAHQHSPTALCPTPGRRTINLQPPTLCAIYTCRR